MLIIKSDHFSRGKMPSCQKNLQEYLRIYKCFLYQAQPSDRFNVFKPKTGFFAFIDSYLTEKYTAIGDECIILKTVQKSVVQNSTILPMVRKMILLKYLEHLSVCLVRF